MGYFENFKVNKLKETILDSHKSKQSIFIIDDLERLIEYVYIG